GNELSLGGGANANSVRLQPPIMSPNNAPPPPVQPLATSPPIGVVTADPPGNSTGTVPMAGTATGRSNGSTYTRITSLEQAQAALDRYSVRWQRLERTQTGDWKFSCSVPDRQDPSKSRTYVAEAATQLGAYQAALERMNREMN